MRAIEVGVIAFGTLSVGLLGLAGMVSGDQTTIIMALLAAGLGYVSQVAFFLGEDDEVNPFGTIGFFLWVGALSAWCAGLVSVIVT